MRNNFLVFVVALSAILISCNKEKPLDRIVDESLAFAMNQYSLMADVMKDKPDLLPRTIDETGSLVTSGSGWWTSGFFPGSLWYLYEYSKDEKFREAAVQMTSRLEKEKSNTGTHDLCYIAVLATDSG
jgi:unsaturated chondroitin disaccharide hydrolase